MDNIMRRQREAALVSKMRKMAEEPFTHVYKTEYGYVVEDDNGNIIIEVRV